MDNTDQPRIERLAKEFKRDDQMESLHRQCRTDATFMAKLPTHERLRLGHYLERRAAHEMIERQNRQRAAV